MDNKLKVLWVSDLVTPTGFSRVSHSLIKHLKNYFDITGVGINYFGDPHNLGIPVFPAYAGGDIYGIKRTVNILNSSKFDLLFILSDVWVVDKFLSAFKKEVPQDKLPKIIVYTPIDAENHDESWYKHFDIVSKLVVYTKFGREVVGKAFKGLSPIIIPHGIDSGTFFKKYKTRRDAKIKLFSAVDKSDSDKKDFIDSFIVLNANRNQPRKKLDVTMQGFALFAKDKPKNVKLYMHCGVVDSSVDVIKLSIRYGIDDRLIISSTQPGVQTVPDERLNDIYNASDVGINTSLGEGWGLTNVEHAMTGAVQIVPDHSACRELFKDAGVLIPVKYQWTMDNIMTVGGVVTPEDVAESLEKVYQNPEMAEELAQKAFDKFSSPKYDWAVIAELWKAIFFEVA